MKTGYKVSDAMTQEPIFVGPNEKIVDCAKKMKEHRVGALLVKEKDNILGICTEQDMTYKVVAENKNPEKILMKDIMCTKVKTITPELDIFEALMKMRDLDVRRLPVVNNGKLVGLLTQNDILKIEPQLFDLLVDKIELREEKKKPIKVKTPNEEVEDIIYH